MQQTTTANGMRKLTAADGHKIIYLSDFSTATDTAYLGVGDSPDNYTEVTDDAVAQWEEQQSIEMQERMQTAGEAAEEA